MIFPGANPVPVYGNADILLKVSTIGLAPPKVSGKALAAGQPPNRRNAATRMPAASALPLTLIERGSRGRLF